MSLARTLLFSCLLATPLALAGCVDQPAFGDAKPPSPAPEPKPPGDTEMARIMAELESIGYVEGTEDPHAERSNVFVHDAERAFPGVNFYGSRIKPEAYLVDMDGRLLHRWQVGTEPWQHTTLLENGDVLVLVKDVKVMRVDRDSRVLWEVEGGFHHALWAHTDGDIYVLNRRRADLPDLSPDEPTMDDLVTVLGPDGERKREYSILEWMRSSPYAYLLPLPGSLPVEVLPRANPKKGTAFEPLHPNHIEVLDGHLAGESPIYAKGNLLLTLRNIHSAVIIDPERGEIVWLWGPSNLIFPHHSAMLENGHVLTFNNGDRRTKTQVIEVDPLTRRVVWRYGPVEGFYSRTRGSNQRLPNGNTLITESDTGYVFEVTPEGDTVWRFANPDLTLTKRNTQRRAAIWRLTRVPRESLAFDFSAGG